VACRTKWQIDSEPHNYCTVADVYIALKSYRQTRQQTPMIALT